MSSSKENNKNKELTVSSRFELFESLVGAAQENFSESNINLLKEGCFSASEIKVMVKSGNLPKPEVLSHLTNCSDCFKEYKFVLQVAKQVSIAASKETVVVGWKNWLSGSQVSLAGTFCIICFLAGAVSFWLFYNKNEQSKVESAQIITVENNNSVNDLAANSPAESKVANIIKENLERNSVKKTKVPENKPIPSISTEKPVEIKKDNPIKTKTTVKSASVYLNLTENETFRKPDQINPDNSDKTAVSLATKEITAKLPSIYNTKKVKFTVVDSVGKTLSAGFSKVNNHTLELRNLNLLHFSRQTVRICLQLEAEVPECFTVKIK
jgi:hypothetical protein